MNPDRIALFHFAYLPALHRHQQKIGAETLPDSWTKIKMFCQAIELFDQFGYDFIGLDHFAKKTDALVAAKKVGTLHRNFQGYTTHAGTDLIGLGVTAISRINGTFAQNSRKLADYLRQIAELGLATTLGLQTSEDDRMRERVISQIFCHQQVCKDGFQKLFAEAQTSLALLKKDRLVEENDRYFHVTPTGRFFLRNIAACFDAYFNPEQTGFSKAL